MGASMCSFWKREINSGSILDRVISESSPDDNCLLYRLANYKKGGELIDAYNSGGQAQVEQSMREQFPQFMYDNGRGQPIKRSEYLRWRFRNQSEVVLPIEASLNRHDPLGKWQDHEACWQMQYRGSLGESLLHVLIICDTKVHTKLARMLLKIFPKLSIDCVEGEEYLGASALHLAIAYNNNELVQDLVEAGANVNQRAIGSFFLPRDQQRRHPSRHTDYEGLAYLGEYPLSWAACCANETVYNLLLDNEANPDMQDSFGNMILHMVVVGDKLDMFGYALRHPKVPAKNGIQNSAGLTPLTLACTLGRASVFREMLELSAREFWRYSNITCSAYPLNALDTLLPDGRTNWNSALFIILNGTKQEHLDMLDGGIIQRLLEEKWKMFAQRQFMKRLCILFLHLFFLSMSIYLRPRDPNVDLLESREWDQILRYCFEVGTVVGVLFYIIVQQGGEMLNQGAVSFLKQLPNEPAKAIFLTSNILLLICIPFRFVGDKQTEEAILVFAVPSSWFLLMFFAGAVRLTGPFITMVYLMLTGDMLTFGIIYSVILFGFSQTFFFMYKGSPVVQDTIYSSYASTWMGLFQLTLGDFDYNELGQTVYPSLSKVVFLMFMVLVPVLLLNMLIAMMGNTYAHVIEQSEKEWMKQWAKVVVAMERAVNQKDAQRYLQEYSMKLGPGDDPSTEERGVLVIKSKNKTRAKQRKGAVSNWKRVGKVTINALRNRGMSGEQLRRLMWGRESISTPVKTSMANIAEKATDLSNSTSPFSGALTAALDIMAFSNEVADYPTNRGRRVSNSSNYLVSESTRDISNDPFRQLVLTSDNPKVEEQELSSLAEAAAKSAECAEELNRQKSLSAASGSKIIDDSQPQFSYLDYSDSDSIGIDDSFHETSDNASISQFDHSFSSHVPYFCPIEYSMIGQRSRAERVKKAHMKNMWRADSLSLDVQRLPGYDEVVKDLNHQTQPVRYPPAPPLINAPIEETQQAANQMDPNSMFLRPLQFKSRPKTSRNNRIGPMPETVRRRSSATGSRHTSQPENSFNLDEDPLKPWSTRNIMNLNSILADPDHSDEENI